MSQEEGDPSFFQVGNAPKPAVFLQNTSFYPELGVSLFKAPVNSIPSPFERIQRLP
jgi:hypothetical protein